MKPFILSHQGRRMIYIAVFLFVVMIISCRLAPSQNKGDPLVNVILFHPTTYHPQTWKEPDFQYEDVTLTTSDGVRINAWYLSAKQPRDTRH